MVRVLRRAYLLCMLGHSVVSLLCAQQLKSAVAPLGNTTARLFVVPGSKGDVDGNGTIDITDLVRARDIAIGRIASPPVGQVFAADLNSNGAVTQEDVRRIQSILLRKTLPPPTIFTVNPSSVRQGDQMVIQGAGFEPEPSRNSVSIGPRQAQVVAASAIELIVQVPAEAATGPVVVTVAGQSSNSAQVAVATAIGGPFITRLAPPAAMRREQITIEGARFGNTRGTSEIRLGGIRSPDSNVVSWSDVKIVVKVPATAFPGLLTVTVAGTTSNTSYLNVTVVEATMPDPADIIANADGVTYVRNAIILDFKNYVSLEAIAGFLSSNNLQQIGFIYRTRKVQARISDGRDPFVLAGTLSGNGLLEGAFPSVISTTKDVASESYPNFPGTPRNLLATYNASKANFDRNLDRSNYHHFAMQTYAGHRLAEMILGRLGGTLPDVRVAIIDGGLGDGSTDTPAEFSNRIRAPTSVGYLSAVGVTSGVSRVVNIPDGPNHGTPVAGLAAGGGIVALGTGKHVNIRPLQTSTAAGKFDPFLISGAVEIATDDPQVKVINCSIGSYDRGKFDFTNAISRSINSEIYDDEMLIAVSKGKILVFAAGNETVDARLSAPSVLAPEEPRVAGASTMLNVSATEADFEGDALLERLAGYSNFGTKISVSAPGSFSNVFAGSLLNNSYLSSGGDGTSFAAPLVSGLAAEMILLDKSLVQLGERPSEMSSTRIIEILESTVDDLGSAGYDPHFGHGRINVWKALLAIANGGPQPQVASPSWYGMEIRASTSAPSRDLTETLIDNYKAAQVYVSNKLLSDVGNSNTTTPTVTLYKRVFPLRGLQGQPLLALPDDTASTSDFLSTFSVTASELTGSGSTPPRLQLRQSGKAADAPPLFELPLDLARMRAGIPNLVSYDDFVFSVQVPRVVEMSTRKSGGNRTITKSLNGKNITFPIGSVGDSLRFQISYSGFVPTAANTDIEFFARGRTVMAQPVDVTNLPGLPVTSRFAAKIPEHAETGSVLIRTVTQTGDPSVSFSSLNDLIIPRVVGVNPLGTNPGDLVRIAIQVKHFDALISNTKIKFPGTSPETAPDRVLASNDTNVTNILETKIPANLSDGPVKITIVVDQNQKVEFEGGGLQRLEKTPYAGTLKVTRMIVQDDENPPDQTPPPGKNTLPIRCVLNKTQIAQGGKATDTYYLTAPVENWLFAFFGSHLSDTLKQGNLTLTSRSPAGSDTLVVRVVLTPLNGGQQMTGTYSFTLGSLLIIEGDLSLSIETTPAEFNGVFAGRFVFQSKTGDKELLDDFQQNAEGEFYPMGFTQVNTQAGLIVLNSDNSGGTSASQGLPVLASQATLMGHPLRKFPGLPARFPSVASTGYSLLQYVVETVSGNHAKFIIDDALVYPRGDPDTTKNASITYDLTKNADRLSGGITVFQGVLRPDSVGNLQKLTATFNFTYTGSLQREDSNAVTFIAVTPPPERGFPPVSANSVSLSRVSLSYNYIDAEPGAVVLRAFKNNNPAMILAEVEKPIPAGKGRAGSAVFTPFSIPNVGPDVTSISVVAGLRIAGATAFVAQTNVLSYSR